MVPGVALAIAGPIAGTWYRLTSPDENSGLIIGSRAGLALSEDDLTQVRFPVGSAARAAGIRPGDDIIAINDVPIARVVPISERGIARPNDATDSDYAAFSRSSKAPTRSISTSACAARTAANATTGSAPVSST